MSLVSEVIEKLLKAADNENKIMITVETSGLCMSYELIPDINGINGLNVSIEDINGNGSLAINLGESKGVTYSEFDEEYTFHYMNMKVGLYFFD